MLSNPFSPRFLLHRWVAWWTTSSTSARGVARTRSCPRCCHRNGRHLQSHSKGNEADERHVARFVIWMFLYLRARRPRWACLDALQVWLDGERNFLDSKLLSCQVSAIVCCQGHENEASSIDNSGTCSLIQRGIKLLFQPMVAPGPTSVPDAVRLTAFSCLLIRIRENISQSLPTATVAMSTLKNSFVNIELLFSFFTYCNTFYFRYWLRVGITIDPGDNNGFATGNEEEGDSTGTKAVHQLEKYNSTLKNWQKQIRSLCSHRRTHARVSFCSPQSRVAAPVGNRR